MAFSSQTQLVSTISKDLNNVNTANGLIARWIYTSNTGIGVADDLGRFRGVLAGPVKWYDENGPNVAYDNDGIFLGCSGNQHVDFGHTYQNLNGLTAISVVATRKFSTLGSTAAHPTGTGAAYYFNMPTEQGVNIGLALHNNSGLDAFTVHMPSETGFTLEHSVSGEPADWETTIGILDLDNDRMILSHSDTSNNIVSVTGTPGFTGTQINFTTPGRTTIGCVSGLGETTPIDIQDVRLYNYALSEQDRQAIHNGYSATWVGSDSDILKVSNWNLVNTSPTVRDAVYFVDNYNLTLNSPTGLDVYSLKTPSNYSGTLSISNLNRFSKHFIVDGGTFNIDKGEILIQNSDNTTGNPLLTIEPDNYSPFQDRYTIVNGQGVVVLPITMYNLSINVTGGNYIFWDSSGTQSLSNLSIGGGGTLTSNTGVFNITNDFNLTDSTSWSHMAGSHFDINGSAYLRGVGQSNLLDLDLTPETGTFDVSNTFLASNASIAGVNSIGSILYALNSTDAS